MWSSKRQEPSLWPQIQFESRVVSLDRREEAKVVASNWSSLQQSALFLPLQTVLTHPSVDLPAPFVHLAVDLIDQQLQLYAKPFSHSLPFAGALGFVWYLRSSSHSADSPSYQNLLQTLKGQSHFETLFAAANLVLCEAANELTGRSSASLAHAERRVRHKTTYIQQMRELAFLLKHLADSQLRLEIPEILSILREAASLYQRTCGKEMEHRREYVITSLLLRRFVFPR